MRLSKVAYDLTDCQLMKEFSLDSAYPETSTIIALFLNLNCLQAFNRRRVDSRESSLHLGWKKSEDLRDAVLKNNLLAFLAFF